MKSIRKSGFVPQLMVAKVAFAKALKKNNEFGKSSSRANQQQPEKR